MGGPGLDNPEFIEFARTKCIDILEPNIVAASILSMRAIALGSKSEDKDETGKFIMSELVDEMVAVTRFKNACEQLFKQEQEKERTARWRLERERRSNQAIEITASDSEETGSANVTALPKPKATVKSPNRQSIDTVVLIIVFSLLLGFGGLIVYIVKNVGNPAKSEYPLIVSGPAAQEQTPEQDLEDPQRARELR